VLGEARIRWRDTPAFGAVCGLLEQLPSEGFPNSCALNIVAERSSAPRTAAGRTVRFVAQPARLTLPYERFVFETGQIPIRPEDWHDLFNALVWIAFPRTKAALNARHVREMQREVGGRRGAVRDALTQFDEDGLIVLARAPALLALIREFKWKELFWGRRRQLTRDAAFFAFGHALQQKLLAPFVGITGKALLFEVESDLLYAPRPTLQRWIDERLAERIASLVCAKDLAPVPVLGIPGWWPANIVEAFYNNAWYFRAGRGVVARERGAVRLA
jgi:hypothetical protein